MKKLTGALLGATLAIGFLMMTANTPMTAKHYVDIECKWKQFHCEYSEISYEGCLQNGDGKKCDCGAVTRDCGGNSTD